MSLKFRQSPENWELKPALIGSFNFCLQRSIDDKFCCLEERDGQLRRLQLALREKERDLERLRCILANNEETITVHFLTCLSCCGSVYSCLPCNYSAWFLL